MQGSKDLSIGKKISNKRNNN